MSRFRARLGWFTAVVIGALLALQAAARFSSPGQPFKFLALYARVLHLTRENYVDPVDAAALEQRAADGIFNGLDGESGRIEADWTPERRTAYGMLLRSGGGYTQVLSVARGCAAEKAGFAAGDVIRRVDGKSVFGLQLPRVRAMLAAAARDGKPVDLLKGRDEEKKSLTLAGPPECEWGGVERFAPAAAGDPIRIALRNTRPADADALLAALAAARAETPGAPVLLDLRDNPGEDFSGAARIAGALGGRPFSVEGNPGGSHGAPEALSFPPATAKIDGVLADRTSTRGAEALAAALKAAGVPVYGRSTGGQATLQARVTLADGRLLWMTVKAAKLDGNWIGTNGLEPSEAAPADAEDLAAFAAGRMRAPAAASAPGSAP